MNFLVEVYHSLIRLLVLNDHHRIMLNKRGLSNETIQMNEYRSLPLSWKDMAGLCLQIFQKFGERIFTLPGFYRTNNPDRPSVPAMVWKPGILIPNRDEMGHIHSLAIRFDDNSDGGSRYLTFSCVTPNFMTTT